MAIPHEVDSWLEILVGNEGDGEELYFFKERASFGELTDLVAFDAFHKGFC